jgi:purine-cytosine permease-like protein
LGKSLLSVLLNSLTKYFYRFYGVSLPVLLNLATITGFAVIDSVVGGQTLAAVNPGSISRTVGIVIIALIALVISFCGINVLHQFERYAWIPSLIGIIIAVGYVGKHLSQQAEVGPPEAATVLSFGGLVAGFIIPWGAMSSDFATYIRPDAPA